jgi:transmembrane sensor
MWLVRRDRGLSADEAGEFARWLEASPDNRAALAEVSAAWSRIDGLPETEGKALLSSLVARRRKRRRAAWMAGVGLAASLAVVWTLRSPPSAPVDSFHSAQTNPLIGPRSVVLPDGSAVHITAGGRLRLAYSATERTIAIELGEARFNVARDPQRPFIVRAGLLEVRAIGTAFRVSLQAEKTAEVVVTEGKVEVSAAPDPVPPTETTVARRAAGGSPLTAGHRAVAQLDASARATMTISELDAATLARERAAEEPLLRLGGLTLAQLAAEFQQRTGQRIQFADPGLASRRVGGRFRADDVAGFVRLLEEDFGLRSVTMPDGVIVLHGNAARK